MTRILSWNIQDFSLTRLQFSQQDPTLLRAQYIVDTIQVIAPDIFVLVEVESALPHAWAGRGFVVAETSGGPAVRTLLSELRLREPGADWRLVPPLLSGAQGKKEGVGVFFKNSVVEFRGPQQVDTTILTGTNFQRNGGVAGGANQPYLAPWDWVLPATVPGGPAIGNPARQQNQLCGQPYFEDPGKPHAALDFPTSGDRSPFLTVFREVAGANRIITVLGCHLPPHTGPASQAVDQILKIPDLFGPMAANEVRVICGDFNINFFDPAKLDRWNKLILTNVLRPAGATQYRMLNWLTPSMHKGVNAASLAGIPTNFDVISTGWDIANNCYRNPGVLQSLDAIFGAFGTGAAPWPPGQVANRVANTPYVVPLPAGGIPEAMAVPVATQLAYRAAWHPPVLPTPDEVFRRMENYGKIRGASDHMPVYAVV